MIRKMIITLLLFGISIVTYGCEEKTLDSQVKGTIVIKNNENILRYLSSNTKSFDYENIYSLKELMKQDKENIPYIKIGEMITIEFKEENPDSLILFDDILNQDGTLKYRGSQKTIELQKKGELYRIPILEHFATNLSSNISDYNQGSTFRGFRVIGKWGGEQREIAFVIRTDPK
ncbi:hypothetical protein ACTHPH_04575 [Paenibacillus pasadenensis]|uniref:hypothetical protein n=1 Tax=Paenibacillus TaxID=44249 RepID=UPI00040DAA51|nr:MULTISPECIES: hypothetical protein [Paenibacillus]QGG54815.1 hypothetical protein GE073_03915 [Paenibacillus sp. B01]